MVRLSVLLFLGAISGAALAQDKDKDKKAGPGDLPTACEIRAYYLDKDYKACDASDVKAVVVFEGRDGKSQKYPMTLVKPVNPAEKAPAGHFFGIEGTDYRFAVVATCTDASQPGGNSAYDKPFLKPLPIKIEPEPKADNSKREIPANGSYFKAYLNRQDIEHIQKAGYTDVAIVFTVHGADKRTHCFSCVEGNLDSSAPSSRVSAELKTLEAQVQAGETEKAKATMARIRENVAALPATPANEKARAECASCCKDLEAAVNSGNKEKALKEIHKLQAKIEACDACEREAKPQNKK